MSRRNAVCAGRGWLRTVAGALRERRGAAMIEFAILAIPFLMLLFGIIELGLILIVDVNLSNATLGVARQLRVGALVAPGASVSSSSGTQLSLNDFKQTICNALKVVPGSTCMSNLQIDLRVQSAFAGQNNPNPVSGTNFSTSAFCYYSGGPGNIIELRAFYLWSMFNPILLAPLVQVKTISAGNNSSTGNFFMLISSEVFKNEPNANVTNTGNNC